jgi:hypothetical protein
MILSVGAGNTVATAVGRRHRRSFPLGPGDTVTRATVHTPRCCPVQRRSLENCYGGCGKNNYRLTTNASTFSFISGNILKNQIISWLHSNVFRMSPVLNSARRPTIPVFLCPLWLTTDKSCNSILNKLNAFISILLYTIRNNSVVLLHAVQSMQFTRTNNFTKVTLKRVFGGGGGAGQRYSNPSWDYAWFSSITLGKRRSNNRKVFFHVHFNS